MTMSTMFRVGSTEICPGERVQVVTVTLLDSQDGQDSR
jgi:hypothetical protein